jgi:amino-acid N-acetyltransferase
MIRAAKINDAEEMSRLINKHASSNLMLPIALNQIYDQLRDFVVAEAEGEIIGCGAMHITWKDLGEIRSVAIEESHRKQGVGTQIVNRLLTMALEMEVKRLFVLTYQPKFFDKFGFSVIDKEALPHKIWRVCINCHKFPNCDEIAMIKEI